MKANVVKYSQYAIWFFLGVAIWMLISLAFTKFVFFVALAIVAWVVNYLAKNVDTDLLK